MVLCGTFHLFCAMMRSLLTWETHQCPLWHHTWLIFRPCPVLVTTLLKSEQAKDANDVISAFFEDSLSLVWSPVWLQSLERFNPGYSGSSSSVLVVYTAVDKLPGLVGFLPSTPLGINPVVCDCIYCTFVIAKVKLGACDHSVLGVSVWWEDCPARLAKVFCHDWIQLSLWSKILESRRPDCSPSLWHCVTARALWVYLFISPSVSRSLCSAQLGV